MTQGIRIIVTKSTMGDVNCYLLEAGGGFILVDTGYSTSCASLENELDKAGCKPGNLRLAVLTHGDIDHTGNCAYLQKKYGVKVAMHGDDMGMAEHGDMSYNRSSNPILSMALRRMPLIFRVISLFSRSSKYEGYKPDFLVGEGFGLSSYGINAKVVHIPGHSKGSIGVLTEDGNLFCGDLLTNMDKPALNAIMDDRAAANASVEKLKSFSIATVYPGHGKPFQWGPFANSLV
jgi:glyoxylase-like metal-dependent hydrolase (beta-lactamase superfamily II)